MNEDSRGCKSCVQADMSELTTVQMYIGAADIEDAQGLLDFAKRFELIRKEQSQKLSLREVDFSDEDDIAASLPG